MRALSLTFAGALLLSTSALASEPAWLHAADADNDGFVTPAEGQVFQTDLFTQLDVNQDGAITEAEWDAMGEFKFAYVDRNSDGVIEPAEIQAASLTAYRFRYYELTDPDYPMAYRVVSPRTTIATATYTHYPYTYAYAVSPPVAYMAPTARVIYLAPKHYASSGFVDSNQDGIMSTDEWTAFYALDFDTFDLDKNGTLSQAELQGNMQLRN